MNTGKKPATFFAWLLRPLSRENGIAMVLVLLSMMSIALLGLFGTYGAQTELNIARNDQLIDRALSTAEAGVNHTIQALEAEIIGGATITTAALSNTGLGTGLGGFNGTKTFQNNTYRFRSFDGAGADDGYYVRMVDNQDEQAAVDVPTTDTDQAIKIIALGRTGTTAGADGSGAVRMVEATVRMDDGIKCAVISRGPLKINGNPPFSGTKGCAHTNRNMPISGDPDFTVQPTASGTMTISGDPELNGVNLSPSAGQPLVPIPSINVLNFNGNNLAQAVIDAGGYILHSNGQVTKGGTATCAFPAGCTVVGATASAINCDSCTVGGVIIRWKIANLPSGSDPAKWDKVGDDPGPHVPYFIEGQAVIGSNPGEPGNPWRTTIVAMNSIDISGNPDLAPFNGPWPTATAAALQNLLLVSGNDIGLGGNAGTTTAPGAILAHQQIKINGNAHINGFILAEDAGRALSPPLPPVATIAGDPAPNCTSLRDIACDPVGNEISGSLHITYNGNFSTSLFPPNLSLVSWNEVRN